ncbi:ATP synthase F1, H+-transporting two-sector ATPase gamma subunit [Rhodopirellula baltica WH47]|uniref:ATP synthase F1, H+-transporting two-sector ATPase gamma subunit n=2 Tax=Rhodopirellula baltica TaxID=265606 RepID=F2AQ10_RHOBT|nr:ATP synthase F1, H+-transporting two-sector ATPase gamma subunit [Rhodopirellula baltica WH47]
MADLRRKISTADDLQSVVRTMKAMAASSVEQYERSVLALHDYYQVIELGLSACFQKGVVDEATSPLRAGLVASSTTKPKGISAIVFGSDQGLVGQFNDVITDFAVEKLSDVASELKVWAVGERVHGRLADSGLPLQGLFPVPNSVKGIASLVGLIQIESISNQLEDESTSVFVFHNRPQTGSLYKPVSQRLLPLDWQWKQLLTDLRWPTHSRAEILGDDLVTLQSLIHEYLFITLYRSCAESLASENASRLVAMQRADKNIDELLETLHTRSHRQRQGSIDEELFDVVSGFDALSS